MTPPSLSALRVAMVAYPGRSTIGGITLYVASLAAHLAERGIRVGMVTSDPEASANDDGATVGGHQWTLARSTYLALCRLNPDVVHCHDNPWMGLGSALYARRHGKRFVFTLHTQLTRRSKRPTRHVIHRLQARAVDFLRVQFYRLIVRSAHAATAVSTALAKDVGAAGVTVVPFGVNPRIPVAAEIDAFRAIYPLGEGPIIASIGVFYHEWKIAGFELLISAFAAISQRHPAAVLVIAGDGDQAHRHRLQTHTRALGVADQTIFTGYLKDVTPLLSVCDIYAHLALNEALGFAIAEAMFFGRPVVAANLAGIPELVESGQTGLLVQPTIDDTARGLEWVLANPEQARRMGEAAQERIRTSYTWTAVTDVFRTLYGISYEPSH